MSETTKRIMTIAGVLVIAGTVTNVISYTVKSRSQEKSVFQYSNAEYVDKASEACSKDGTPESTCRCFYSKFLETHTVQETLKFDAEATANPDFEPTQEQARLVAECL